MKAASHASQQPSLLQLTPDLAVQPSLVAAVKRSGLADQEDSHCVVYLAGQGALDGFVVERGFEEVVSEIDEALDEAAAD